MEEHIILKLPDELQVIFDQEIKQFGAPKCSFNFTNPNKIQLESKGKLYQGALIRLPCFLETHKSLDGSQLYKMNEVKHMIVIWPKNFDEKQKEHFIKIYSNSGITPPLKFVRFRRWKKQPQKEKSTPNVKEIVAELLRKDSLATHVEVKKFNFNKIDNNDDSSSIAAELEKDLHTSEEDEKETEIEPIEETQQNIEIKAQMKEIEQKIEEKKQFLSEAKNPIVRKRFEELLKNLKKEYEDLKKQL